MILQESPEKGHNYGERKASKQNSVLVIESDRALCEGIRQLFERYGFVVTLASSGREALASLAISQPSLCILGDRLPDTTSSNLFSRVRTTSTFPVLLICSEREVIGLSQTCTGEFVDFMMKPLEGRELIEKSKNLMVRMSSAHRRIVTAGDLSIDESARIATYGETELELTETEFKVLTILATNRGRAISRDRLFEFAWGYEIDFNSNSLEVIVYRLRNKIKKAGGVGQAIQTVRGFGYKLDM